MSHSSISERIAAKYLQKTGSLSLAQQVEAVRKQHSSLLEREIEQVYERFWETVLGDRGEDLLETLEKDLDPALVTQPRVFGGQQMIFRVIGLQNQKALNVSVSGGNARGMVLVDMDAELDPRPGKFALLSNYRIDDKRTAEQVRTMIAGKVRGLLQKEGLLP